VADFNRRGITLERPTEPRSRGSRFGELGDRLTRTFSKFDQTQAPSEKQAQVDHSIDVERAVRWDEPLPRFPITRQGYDCAAVDEHVAELEQELNDLDRELAQLRVQAPSKGEVAAEMERIGEQTSAILIAAHEQAKETTRLAQAQADRCIADAASNAIATNAEAQRQLRELETERTSLGRERERLLEDIRCTAASLSSLADDAAGRFPPSPEDVSPAAGRFPSSPEDVSPPAGRFPPSPEDVSPAAERFPPTPENVSPATAAASQPTEQITIDE
jgi:hypothetical protein